MEFVVWIDHLMIHACKDGLFVKGNYAHVVLTYRWGDKWMIKDRETGLWHTGDIYYMTGGILMPLKHWKRFLDKGTAPWYAETENRNIWHQDETKPQNDGGGQATRRPLLLASCGLGCCVTLGVTACSLSVRELSASFLLKWRFGYPIKMPLTAWTQTIVEEEEICMVIFWCWYFSKWGNAWKPPDGFTGDLSGWENVMSKTCKESLIDVLPKLVMDFQFPLEKTALCYSSKPIMVCKKVLTGKELGIILFWWKGLKFSELSL